ELAGLFVAERRLPAAAVEPAAPVLVGAAGALVHAVERHELRRGQLHGCSPSVVGEVSRHRPRWARSSSCSYGSAGFAEPGNRFGRRLTPILLNAAPCVASVAVARCRSSSWNEPVPGTTTRSPSW